MGEAAEPIKDLKQLEKMKEELKLIPHGEIFYLIFEFGLNSGLRIYKRLENFEERLISTLDYAIKNGHRIKEII